MRLAAGPIAAGQARRAPGRVLAEARWPPGPDPATRLLDENPPADVQAGLALMATTCQAAWSWVLERFQESADLRVTVESGTNHDLSLRFMMGGAFPSGYAKEPDAVAVAIELASLLKQDELGQGLQILLGLGLIHALLCRRHRDPRAALHGWLEFHGRLTPAERAALDRVLASPLLDPGRLFARFLHQSVAADSAEARDRHITWLLGQDRIDLPYDRRQAGTILDEPTDPDEQRRRLYELLRNYDRVLERNNIERVAAELRASRELLVFGRMSRAFHNQALLLADAVLVRPAPHWPQLADRLDALASDEAATRSAVARLQMLLRSPDELPLSRLEGALEGFEEAIIEHQQASLAAALKPGRERVEQHADSLAAPTVATPETQSILAWTDACLQYAGRLRQEFLQAGRRPAAYVVISQRPSPTGSHLLIKLNEFADPYAGKSDNLRKLTRLAGHRVYGSPDYGWLERADHWIEAIPLFIKEEVRVDAGRETLRTVVDIAGMEEAFREEMADHWAINLRQVLDSECLALAREWMSGEAGDEAACLNRLIAQGVNPAEIAAVGWLFAEAYRQRAGEVQRAVEQENLPPYEAARLLLPETDLLRRARSRHRDGCTWQAAATAALAGDAGAGADSAALDRFLPGALLPRRPLPALHLLTTQSAGMTDGYVRTWLEESMALFNIVEAHDLQEQVEARRQWQAGRVDALGEKLIRERGRWVEVEELQAAESLDAAAAMRRLVARNPSLREDLCCLGALLEQAESAGDPKPARHVDDPETVTRLLADAAEQLRAVALQQVLERHEASLRPALDHLGRAHPDLAPGELLERAVGADADYREELEASHRSAARRLALERLDAEQPELHLLERCRGFLRRHRELARTTARKHVIAEQGLAHLVEHPLYRYRATGGGKRYHLLYTPSRVDLGERERESVETWAQWAGGADPAAIRAGRALYGLINKNVRAFDSLAEPEVLKTGENAAMASHYAFSNALSLMVTATRRGDFEVMADQMNRRRDRRVHPAGEGYGGYCVPKDGLFLEFVLSLRRGEKLSQIGVPESAHGAVVRLVGELLEARPSCPSTLDWEEWAAARLREAGLPPSAGVFQPTRVAELLEGLGQPALRDGNRLATGLAARWGLHKMVTGGEQVNRFMPFFKVWLIRQALAEAARRHPAVRPNQAVVVLTAEYKPDTQDGRFSAGMRKFEILAGSGGHLVSALDAEGQDLVRLLDQGYANFFARGGGRRIREWLAVDPADDRVTGQLGFLFPAGAPPAEIRLVAPTGLSTQDLLHYTSDTRLPELAETARAELLAAGFTDRDIEANLRSHGPRLALWEAYRPLAPAALHGLRERLGGPIHGLSLAVLGPDRDYGHALRGADVLDTGIPHRGLLDLLADPGRLCDLMLAGNPRSALAIVDGAAGARPRALNRLDAMLWFAAGDRRGREPVYQAIGLGAETVESWRAAMRRARKQAEALQEAMAGGDRGQATQLLALIGRELREEGDADAALDETARLVRGGRARDRDRVYAENLARLAGGAPLEALDFAGFLALGGLFLLAGAEPGEVEASRLAFLAARRRLWGEAGADDVDWRLMLFHSRQPPERAALESRGVESSNKAVEERPEVPLATRRQLAERLARARGLNERHAAFAAVVKNAGGDFAPHYAAALAALGAGDEAVSEADFGRFIGHCRLALTALAQALANTDQRPGLLARIDALCTGRRIDTAAWQAMAGGYEDIGDIGRLAQAATEPWARGDLAEEERQRQLGLIAQAAELLEILLAVDRVQDTLASAAGDPLPLWRALADFFAATLNDHHHEYRPWLLSRGIGFNHLAGDELYSLAVERHAWLYRYLRGMIVRHTEAGALPADELAALIGGGLDERDAAAIGAEADSSAERSWRAYGQLREIAFIRNDGFPLPLVFPEFDPALIADRRRVNHIIAAPVGRTHYSRLLREGPTLSAELEQTGRPGANLIIGRKLELATPPGSLRPTAWLCSGHLYLDAAACRAALERHKPGTPLPDIHPKGIRVAARFTRPVQAALVYPFHGDPAYTSGSLEAAGLPYTTQSLFHTWTTYDKAKYPEIFREAGVKLPAEIDWLAAWTTRADAATVKGWIREGLPGTTYPGLAAFGRRYPRLMVKDAAGSGGRNMRAFQVDRPEELAAAVDFVHQLALRHNVAVQEVIQASPECWATEDFMRDFVRRQIVEWGQPVERRREPCTPVYGSLRLMLSTDRPEETDPVKKWHASHWITLNSLQLITNVGRGGTLEQLRPEFIRRECRTSVMDRLLEAAQRAAEALSAYADRAAADYERETGRSVGSDLMGVSYGRPRYLMLDFLLTPVFAEPGTLVAIRPRHGDDGERVGSDFILESADRRHSVRPIDWRAVLIEPNIGIGLWDRVALREEVHELRRAETEGRSPDWDRVGEEARVILRDLHTAGEAYLDKLQEAGEGLP